MFTNRLLAFGLIGLIAFISIGLENAHSQTCTSGGSAITTPVGGETISCTGSTTITSGVNSQYQTPFAPGQSASTLGNGVTITVDSGTTMSTSVSAIGLGSGLTATNNGTINTSANYGYGITAGINGRSQAGGNNISNTGTITTTGPNSSAIAISASNLTSTANTINNTGVLSTTGSGSHGIQVVNGGAITTINNTSPGKISAAGLNSNGIQVTGAANITNSGIICPSGISGGICVAGSGTGNGIQIDNNPNPNRSIITNLAGGLIGAPAAANYAINSAQQPGVDIYNSGTISAANATATAINFAGSTSGGSNNTVTLYGGSTLVGGINFNKGNTQESLTFSGYSNSSFSNPIAGLNIVNVVSSSSVTMNSSAGYELVSGVINVENTNSSLAITTAIKDQASPTAATSSITKTGTGNLTLSGANTYSGATNIQAGSIITNAVNTLPSNTAVTIATGAALTMNNNSQLIGSLSGSGTANLGSGTLTTGNNNTSTTFSGTVLGTGGITKVGTGLFALTGTNSYTGATEVQSGVLRISSPVSSNVTVGASGTLQDNSTITGNVTNSGIIQSSFNSSVANLTINGNYIGNNGTFISNVWGPNSSPVADNLIISGASHSASGATGLVVVDQGGLGKPTTGNGIQVVTATSGATTGTSAFALSARVASGAYEYKLYRGTGSDNNWYLSTNEPVVPITAITPDVRERVEVAVYPALPSLMQLYAQTAVDTLDQRRGDLNLVDPDNGAKKKSNDWARIIGKTGVATPSSINDGPKLNFNAYALQFGSDFYKNEEGGSRTYIGPYVTIGSANGNTSNQAGTVSTGSLNGMQAYSIGAYITHFSQNGIYVDALAQGSKYLNANTSSLQGAQLKTQGSGFTGSLEGGGRWNIAEKWLISPQAQLVYDAIGMNNASDAYGQIAFNKSEMTRGRLGLLAGHKDVVGSTPVFAYLRASYWNVFNPGTSTTFQSLYGVNPITFQSQTASRWMTVDAEVNAKITKDTNLFLNLAVDNSLMGTYQAYSGRVGLQTRF